MKIFQLLSRDTKQFKNDFKKFFQQFKNEFKNEKMCSVSGAHRFNVKSVSPAYTAHFLVTMHIFFYYYWFKIFSHFWLVKTTRIIHYHQILFTKFGKNLRHIKSMTSKVQPVENYWTDDIKMTSKVQPAADYWTVDRENLGTRLCYIWWAEKQRA